MHGILQQRKVIPDTEPAYTAAIVTGIWKPEQNYRRVPCAMLIDPEIGSGDNTDTQGTPIVIQPTDDEVLPYGNIQIRWNMVKNATSGVTAYLVKVTRDSDSKKFHL